MFNFVGIPHTLLLCLIVATPTCPSCSTLQTSLSNILCTTPTHSPLNFTFVLNFVHLPTTSTNLSLPHLDSKSATPLYILGMNLTFKKSSGKFAQWSQESKRAALTSYKHFGSGLWRLIHLKAILESFQRINFLLYRILQVSFKAQYMLCNSPKYELSASSLCPPKIEPD